METHYKTDLLLDLTQAMLAAAESDDWDEFELQEQRRSTILKRIFDSQQPITEPIKLQLNDIVEQIQKADKSIINLLIQQRDQASEELRNLRHAREGDKAYRITADDPYN